MSVCYRAVGRGSFFTHTVIFQTAVFIQRDKDSFFPPDGRSHQPVAPPSPPPPPPPPSLHLVNIISESSSESNLCSLAADSGVPSLGLLSLFKVGHLLCGTFVTLPPECCLGRPDREATLPPPPVSCQGQKLTAICPRTNLLPLPTPPDSPCLGSCDLKNLCTHAGMCKHTHTVY